MTATVQVPLIYGLRRNGEPQCQAWVRPLTGADEAMLAGFTSQTLVRRTTALIASATVQIGEVKPIGAAEARALTVGDRETILFAVYRATFGPAIEAVVGCSNESCRERVELSLSVDDLLGTGVPPEGSDQRELVIAIDGVERRVLLRLPTGADQEAVATLALRDSAAAADQILQRCILDGLTEEEARHGLSATAREALADALAGLDPAAETVLRLDCPACGDPMSALLDAGAFLIAELAQSGDLFAEVDRIARVYHWSERDILALPVARRRRYLALVAA